MTVQPTLISVFNFYQYSAVRYNKLKELMQVIVSQTESLYIWFKNVFKYYVQVISILSVLRMIIVSVKENMENFGEPVDACIWGSVVVHCPRLVWVCCVPCAERAFSAFRYSE